MIHPMRPIDTIVVHHSASPRDTTLAEIRQWHTDPQPVGRGWADVGYHYVVDGNGIVRLGRPVDIVGAHVKDQNTGKIGVCVTGDNTVGGRGWTKEQVWTLRQLVKSLRICFGDSLRVCGHRDLANTECPGVDVRALLGEP